MINNKKKVKIDTEHFPQEAITRLAGKSAKMKEFKDDLKCNIIDVNEDDMKVALDVMKSPKLMFIFRATQSTG